MNVAITVAVENRRAADTAQRDAEATVTERLRAAGISATNIRWSETVSRPSFTDGDTTWAIQVTAEIHDSDEHKLDGVDAENIEAVSISDPA